MAAFRTSAELSRTQTESEPDHHGGDRRERILAHDGGSRCFVRRSESTEREMSVENEDHAEERMQDQS